MQAFGLAHLVGAFLYFVQEVLHFLHTSGGIGSHGVAELLQAELHVVEVGNGFAQCVGDIGQHGLEVTESGTCIVRILRIHRLVGFGTGDEYHDAPVAFAVVPVSLAIVGGRQEVEYFTLYIGLSVCFELPADVTGHGVDVGLQHLHILEDGMVDALQDVVGSIVLDGSYFVRVVD